MGGMFNLRDQAGAAFGATVPWAWATGDTFQIVGRFEGA